MMIMMMIMMMMMMMMTMTMMMMIMMMVMILMMMLRDYNISGRINLMEIPVLLHMLHFWKVSTSNMSHKVCLS